MTIFILMKTANSIQLSKKVENTVGKGEIARYEQFLLFTTAFSKDLYHRHVKNQGLFEKRVNQDQIARVVQSLSYSTLC